MTIGHLVIICLTGLSIYGLKNKWIREEAADLKGVICIISIVISAVYIVIKIAIYWNIKIF